jgi:ATP-dependent Clp protease ATP-binding subunit ClpX
MADNKKPTTRRNPGMTDSDGERPVYCSFCGRSSDEVLTLISAPFGGALICDICTANHVDLLRAHLPQFANRKNARVSGLGEVAFPGAITPSGIEKALSEFVIEQDRAKRVLSVAVYNHYKRIDAESLLGVEGFEDTEIEKANILLLGPTGTGKTLLAQTMAKVLDVPFAIADATTLTEAGYVGDDVESILSALLQAADYDVEKAERGIIYLDEIDKISRKSDSASITRDVSGEGVQQGLLKLLEGTVAGVPPKGGRKHPEQPLVHINTKHILFIAGGAFAGLDKIILKRLHQNPIGFGAKIPSKIDEKAIDLFQYVEPEDLLKFGFIPELVGRLPVVAPLNGLSREALFRVLTEPRNALVKQYRKLFAMEGVELEFDNAALEAVIDLALLRGTGARSLRSILEHALLDIMFHLPDNKRLQKVVITRDCIEGRAPAIQINAERKAAA